MLNPPMSSWGIYELDPAQGRGGAERPRGRRGRGTSQDRIRARVIGIPGAAPGVEAAGGVGPLLAYTKFTFKEFRVCVRAIFAAAGGVQTSLVGTVQGMMASARRVPPQAATRATTRRARPEPGRRQEQPGRSQPIRRRLRTLGLNRSLTVRTRRTSEAVGTNMHGRDPRSGAR